MPGPLVNALIAHLDSSFEGPNGDYPAILEAIAGLTAQQAVWRPSPESNSIWQIVVHLASGKQWQLDMLQQGHAETHPWTQPPEDEESWRALSVRLKEAHLRLKSAIGELRDEELLEFPVPELRRSLLELILSSGSAHEAHHGGVISYLRGLQGL